LACSLPFGRLARRLPSSLAPSSLAPRSRQRAPSGSLTLLPARSPSGAWRVVFPRRSLLRHSLLGPGNPRPPVRSRSCLLAPLRALPGSLTASDRQGRDIDPAALGGGPQRQPGQLHALGTLGEVPAQRRALRGGAEEMLPLHLERVVEGRVVRDL